MKRSRLVGGDGLAVDHVTNWTRNNRTHVSPNDLGKLFATLEMASEDASQASDHQSN
jgi:hypothetical protein